MNRAYFYREKKGLFVVMSLAGWLVVLGLFGRYLPANAQVNSIQMAVTIHGHDVVGNWVKENGRWKFHKISKIIRINRLSSRKIASVTPPTRPVRPRSAAGRTPVTTASVPLRPSKKLKKRAVRAKLADEIGRWAKIDNRWEWRRTVNQSGYDKVRRSDARQARWIRRAGVWVFDIPAPRDLIINI